MLNCGRAFAVVLLSCFIAMSAYAQPGPMVEIVPGTTVRILWVGPFSSADGWSALMLRYETQLDFGNEAKLRLEADAIWSRFINDVEHAKRNRGVIAPSAPAAGGALSRARSYNFVYTKEDGVWRATEQKTVTQKGLTEDFVKSFMARIDELYRRRLRSALALYLAKDWMVEAFSATDPMKPPVKMDRFAMLKAMQGLDEIQSKRDIIDIQLSPDRRRARVHSHETETVKQAGTVTTTESNTMNFLEINGQSVVLKRTTAEVH